MTLTESSQDVRSTLIVLRTAPFPMIRFAAKVHDSPDRDRVSLDCVVDAERESVDEVSANVFINHAPSFRIAQMAAMACSISWTNPAAKSGLIC